MFHIVGLDLLFAGLGGMISRIPADLLYFLMRNLVSGEYDAAFTYAADTVYGITGLCLGFILASTVSFYIRKSQSGLGSMKSRLAEPMNKTVRSEK